ncbi:NAD(P)H-dependent oxidoreductase [[Ruminococcus] torques]|uniref:NAD(P)H-dependent oxidoreductase n=1 Tax=[Ruminococcus] torques TaxID=33039 RepID=UPI003C12F9C9
MIKSRNFLKKTELVNYGKKVLIISTSLRGGSNSDILANECAKGVKEAGHDVELLSLKRLP